MGALLLGIDCGLTVTKAAVYDEEGHELGIAAAPLAHASPQPRWIERDMRTVQGHVADVVREALASAGVPGADVRAVGVTGHGDGLYLADAAGEPVRPAILSMDSRAADHLDARAAEWSLDRVLHVTGQVPFPGSTAALVSWMAAHEPASLDRAAWILSCKDWLKLWLTGEATTDPTDASATFIDVKRQQYSDEALRLFGLDWLHDRLPRVVGSTEVAGTVTAAAAEATGLRSGTPVVSGLHDVDACAIGVGAIGAGQLSVVAGSYSINQVVADRPVVDTRWLCRSFPEPGRWLHLGVSPASASNLEWFVTELLSIPGAAGLSRGQLFDLCEMEVKAASAKPREVWYLPFLYGSPLDNRASAAFVGLRGWHTRADLTRALFEGVVFNHMWHVRALESAFELTEARLTGGGSRSATWSQMFADALGLPVTVVQTEESGVFGAALCAGVGIGLFGSLGEATDQLVRVRRTFEPRHDRQADLAEAFDAYLGLARDLAPFWRPPAGGARGGPPR